MINIRPISDLRNSFSKIEDIVLKDGQTLYLTKNGYGSMVVMSIEKYCKLIDNVDSKLDEADDFAAQTNIRHSHNEVFSKVRRKIDDSK